MINFGNSANDILTVYRKAVSESDMRIRNKAFEELEKASKDGFGEGWIAATIWINDHRGDLSDSFFRKENLQGMDDAMDRIYGPELDWNIGEQDD